ncbi:hypothetical protein [Niabella drilacis]|uniref:Uncharacterized protein n=1 Tax=Niabella drilacis (strain DSM 25811 / CCM 8410 / CCUG 62505 / LMG 26954 / E90) TaxID=1285928 RepID=A0A1G7BT44_NIADE|nr:hypothetical protein [Niabella drilacis]SDE30167.1 hypothetical protein SAMN04487894_13311 [Niabella drilacis]
MWKNKLLRSFWLILLVWYTEARAQNAQLTINEAALTAGSASATPGGYNYNPGILGLLTNIMVKGNGDLNPASGPAIPLTKFTATYIKGTAIGTTVTLNTTTARSITSNLLSLLLLSGGPFTVKYEAPDLAATAWQAGTYSNTLAFSLYEILSLGAAVTPASVTLTVVVDPLMKERVAPVDIALLVNELKYFRNTILEYNNALQLQHTIPLQLGLVANTEPLGFENDAVTDPQTSVGKIQVQTGATTLRLSTTSQPLAADVPVPMGNKTNFNVRFFISPSDLIAGFMNKGNYTTKVTLQGANASYPSNTYSKTLNLTVTVNDLSELNVSTTGVTLLFQTAADYKNGVALDIPNHLQVSKTTPYDISVRTQTADFSGTGQTNSGVSFPVSILELGLVEGQSVVNTINALSTTDQLLVSGAPPVVDRFLNIRYRIPSSQTHYLINKPAGTYTASVIYTLTAH